MKVLEKTGKTVDEAVAEALRELGADRSQVEVEVLDEGSKGLLGLLGGRAARVRVTFAQNAVEEGKRFLEELMHSAGLKGEVGRTERGEMAVLEVTGDDLGALIGRRGQALDSLQYLVNVAANRHCTEKQRVVVDVEGYRLRREETLRRLALRMADKVKREHRKTILEPMTPQERRVIHATLQDVSDVFTYSEGEDPFRRVVISPNNRE